MEALLALLAQLAALMAETDSTAEDIETVIDQIDAAAHELAADPDLDDEGLEALTNAATQVEGARADLEARDQAAADRATAAAAALERISGQASTDDGGDDDDAGAGTDDETEETETETGDGGTDETETTDSTETETAETPEAIAAAGGNPPAAPGHISRVAARRPKATNPRARTAAQALGFVASSNAHKPEAKLGDFDKISEVFERAITSSMSYRNGPRHKLPLMLATVNYGDEYQLADNVQENQRKLDKLREGVQRFGSQQALAAAGNCAPYQVMYDQPIVGTDARPVRDAYLTRMQADRGGVTTLPSIRLSQVMDAVDFWDDENEHVVGDTEATSKTVLEVDCDQPVDADTYTVTRILQFKNYQQRYFRERVEAIMKMALVAHARKADRKLISKIADAAIDTTTGQQLGSSRDSLAAIDRALAGTRSRYRIPRNQPMKWGVPQWMVDNLRADLVRELPGSAEERLAMTDAQIEAFFAVRHVKLVEFLDGETGQEFGVQGDGALAAWPSTAITYFTPEGEDYFLDGGGLEIGIVRDSTLNGTNKFQVFAETSEGYLRNGATDPLRIVMDICPDGSTSATRAITPCTIGS